MISGEKLIEIYAAMVKCRMLARRTALLKRQGVLASDLEAGVGREASIAGLAVDLLPGDTLSVARPYSVSSFIKGLPLQDAISSLVTTANGHGSLRPSANGSGYIPVHVIPATVNHSVQLHVACGVALACKIARNHGVAVAFCEDGAESLQGWRDTLTFAGHHDLPILFIHQSGAANERVDVATNGHGEESGFKTQSWGVPAIHVDGQDAVAVYRVASESISRARLGRGPTLIECGTYHVQGDSGVHRKNGRRDEAHDPIRAMEIYLTRKGLFSEKLKRKVTAVFRQELDAATRFLDN